jgi:hypothetical protein
MIARAGSGWQTALADISIILFMITASTLSQADSAPAKPVAAVRLDAPKPSALGEPLAVYLAEPGAPPLAKWLSAQSPDPRQQLTIIVWYAPGGQAAALVQATALAQQSGTDGMAARILVEPGAGGAIATLAYDVPAPAMAQGLQGRP